MRAGPGGEAEGEPAVEATTGPRPVGAWESVAASAAPASSDDVSILLAVAFPWASLLDYAAGSQLLIYATGNLSSPACPVKPAS